MSAVTDILSAFGLTGAIAVAVTAAELDPTSANVQAVIAAYARNGQTPPGPLLSHLYTINRQRHPEDTVASDVLPWLLLGGIIVLVLWKGRK